jgi:membrane associated rhomboid family serine protease
MKKIRRWFLDLRWLLISAIVCNVNVTQSYARRDFFRQQQRPCKGGNVSSLLVADQRRRVRQGDAKSNRSIYLAQQSSTSRRPSALYGEMSKHFLDDDNWMNNKHVRYWDVNMRTRQPGKYSWTTRLIFANVVCYGIQMWKPAFTNWGVKLSHKILKGEDLYRLVTPVFLHGNAFHLFTNLYSLNQVAPTFEKMVGSGRFVAGFLVSGITGNLLSSFQSPNPALGASGAVFGVMAGFYVFLSRHEWLLGPKARSYSDSITSTLLINLAIGFMNPNGKLFPF